MKLIQRMAEAVTDAWIRASSMDLTFASAEAYVGAALSSVPPTGWLVEFPNGTVFIEDEALMRVNLGKGYKVTPLYAGKSL